MKRKRTIKKLLAIILCSSFIFSNAYLSNAQPYSQNDLYRHWSGKYIKALFDNQIAKGYADGTFSANSPATREEAVMMLFQLSSRLPQLSLDKLEPREQTLLKNNKDISNIGYIQVPKDVEGRWSENIFRKLIELGLIKNEPYKDFRPKDSITREEFAELLYIYLNTFELLDNEKKSQFYDLDESQYSESIGIVAGNQIIGGYKDGSFKPKEFLKHGELAAIIVKYAGFEIDELPPIEKKYTVLQVPYVSQIYPVYAPIGCEPTSVYSALKYKGYVNDVSHRQFLDNMPYDNVNPSKGFVGSPYLGYQDYSKRETIFPNALAKYAQTYGNAVDISGSSVEQLQEELYLGNPVIVYLTLKWQAPRYRNYYVEGNTYSWIYNNHVVVLSGYDPQANKYYVSDPLNKHNTSLPYEYWVDGDKFERLYNARRHAIVIR